MIVSLIQHPVIAIDGPAASGKSTFGRNLAARLDFGFVSTGLMYRGVTWFLRQEGVELTDLATVSAHLAAARVETSVVAGELHFTINGVDPLPHVREAKVNDGVSLVAKVPAVRHLLVDQQQQLASLQPLVMEGRDIGTAVFPHTPFKFYLDAAPEIRTARRQQQGETDPVQERDAIDQSRAQSPLVCAADARKLDSGQYRVDELIVQALAYLETQGLTY